MRWKQYKLKVYYFIEVGKLRYIKLTSIDFEVITLIGKP